MKPLEKCVTFAVTVSPSCVEAISSDSVELPFFVQKGASFEPRATVVFITMVTGTAKSSPAASNTNTGEKPSNSSGAGLAPPAQGTVSTGSWLSSKERFAFEPLPESPAFWSQ